MENVRGSMMAACVGPVGRRARVARAFAAAALVAALPLAACTQDGPADETDPVDASAAPADVPAYSAFAGVVSTAGDVEVSKKSDVAVGEVLVRAGDVVHEGDVLFTYDTESASLDLEKANLELAQMQSNLAMTKANKEALEKEKAKADESQQLSYSLEIQEKETSIMEEEYRIQAKEREIEQLRALVEDADVLSPTDGTVRSVNDGSSTSSGGDYYDSGYGPSDGASSAFIVIAKTSDIRVMGSVDEANLAELYEGMAVTVRARTGNGEWAGIVTGVDTEKPLQQNNYYYDPSQSTKYPFYVALDSTEGLVVGQHVYIVAEWGAMGGFEADVAGDIGFVEGVMDSEAEAGLMGGQGAAGDFGDAEGLDAEGTADAADEPAQTLDASTADKLSSSGPAPAAAGSVAIVR